MPQVVAGVVAWYGTLSAGVAFAVKAAVTIALSVVSSKLFGPKIPNSEESLGSKSVMVRSGVEYRTIVYGQAMTSGPMFYYNTSGDTREFLWYALALTNGEIEDLVSVWIDGDEIPKADIDWTAGASGADGTGTGDVSTAKWVGANSTAGVSIFYTLGHPDQVALSKLTTAFTDWTTNHRLRGIACLVVRMRYDEDTETVWETGAPNNIRAVITGRKIYDPRLDSTQIIDSTTSPITYGSGAHRAATESTWAWSDNPALCISDYLMTQMNVDPSSGIDWEAIADSADDCDTLVAIPVASTEKRFTCNGSLSLGASHKDNLDSLLSSCDGRLSYTEGVWRLRVSVWVASSVSYDEDDLAGNVSVRGASPKSERFNTVRGVFIDANKDYEPTEFPIVTNSTYITRDGGEVIMRDLELPMTNSATMAQRIAFRLLEQSDNQQVVKAPLNARGAKCAIGDVVSINITKLGWTPETFRVIEWERNSNGTFSVTGRVDSSASYTDPIEGDYTDGNSANITVPASVVPPPSSLAATAVSGGVELTWTSPPAAEHDYIDIFEDTDSGWAGATHIARVRADNFFVPHTTATPQYYWVRSVRNPDLVSIRDPDSDTTTITATPIIPSDGAAGQDGSTINYTNNSHAVPVDNGGTEDWTGSGGLAYIFEGGTALTLANNAQTASYPASPSRFNLNITKVSGDTLTEPGITGDETTTATLAAWAGNLTQVTVYRLTAWVHDSNGNQFQLISDITLTPADQGADGATGDTGATGDPGTDGQDSSAINYTNNSHSVPVTNTGTEDWSGSGGNSFVFEAGTLLTLNSNTQSGSYPGSNSRYNLNITKVSGDTLTEPAITGSGTTTGTLANWAGNLTQATVYRLTAWVRDSNANTFQLISDITLTPAFEGADGATGSTGAAGADGVLHYLTNEAHVVVANYGGTGYTLINAGGTHKVFDGTTDVTSSSTHEIVGGTDNGTNWTKVQNGLTLQVIEATGVYTLSGTSWVSNEETFTLRATYDTVDYDKTYTIAKALQGNDGGCAVDTLTSISLDDTGIGGTRTVGFRVDSDGTIDTRANNASGYVNKETWIGACANTSYECNFVSSGSALTTGTANTWLACSSDRTFELSRSTNGISSRSGTIQIRRTSDDTVVGTANVSLRVERSL